MANMYDQMLNPCGAQKDFKQNTLQKARSVTESLTLIPQINGHGSDEDICTSYV